VVLDYVDDYRSVEFYISPLFLRPYLLKTKYESLSDEKIKELEMEDLTRIIINSGLDKTIESKKFGTRGLKDGDVIRWNDEGDRNAGRMIWRNYPFPLLWGLYHDWDDYGSLHPDMTANAVGSSIFYDY